MAPSIPDDNVEYVVILKDKLTQKPYNYAYFHAEKDAIETMVYFLKKGDFCIVRKTHLSKKYYKAEKFLLT